MITYSNERQKQLFDLFDISEEALGYFPQLKDHGADETISLRDFLYLTPDIDENTEDEETYKYIQNFIRNKGKIAPFYLEVIKDDINENFGLVYNHEGRHRAIAISQIMDDKFEVPIQIVVRSENGLDWKDSLPKWIFPQSGSTKDKPVKI